MADRRRYTFVLYTAVAVAAAATFGVYRILESAKIENRVATQPVVVAARDLPQGAPITKTDLEVKQWPITTVPAGAFSSPDSLAGRVTQVPVFTGEPFVPGRLAPNGTGPGLEVKIAPGKRAAAIRVNDVSSLSGLIQPNSRVDVMVTLRDERGETAGQVAKIFMENMRVLSVGTRVERDASGQAFEAPTAALEVTPEEAERLAIAANQGAIQLVLRGYGDPDSTNTRGARSGDVLGRLAPAAPAAAAPRPAPAPVRRTPTPPAPRPVAVQQSPAPTPPAAAPARPESTTVQVIRGTAVTQQRFERPDSAKRPPR
jgi:pilus assembly protein CpaB